MRHTAAPSRLACPLTFDSENADLTASKSLAQVDHPFGFAHGVDPGTMVTSTNPAISFSDFQFGIYAESELHTAHCCANSSS
jgi:hypothetical protein